MSIEYFIIGVSVAVTAASVTSAAVPLLLRMTRLRKKTEEDKLEELRQEIETILLHQRELEKESKKYSVELEELIQHHEELLREKNPNIAAGNKSSQAG